MENNLNFEEILKMIKEKTNIIDELKFSRQEIDDNLSKLIKYMNAEKEHEESKEICNAHHIIFLRDENNEIYTKRVYCNKQRKKNNINENILISDYIHNDDYQNILKDDQLKYKSSNKRLKFIKYFKENFSNPESFNLQAQNCFMHGNISSGKSFSGFYLLKCCLHFKKNKQIAYINARVFCNKISESFGNNNLREQINQYLDTLMNVDYLFIDDLGSEKQTQSSLAKLTHLLKERIKSKTKTTIIISSKNINELKKYYSRSENLDYEIINELIYRIQQIAKENEIEIDKVI